MYCVQLAFPWSFAIFVLDGSLGFAYVGSNPTYRVVRQEDHDLVKVYGFDTLKDYARISMALSSCTIAISSGTLMFPYSTSQSSSHGASNGVAQANYICLG